MSKEHIEQYTAPGPCKQENGKILEIAKINNHMTDQPITFVDYTFRLETDGSILFDQELKPRQLGVTNGDKFEVVIIPDIGIVFRKAK